VYTYADACQGEHSWYVAQDGQRSVCTRCRKRRVLGVNYTWRDDNSKEESSLFVNSSKENTISLVNGEYYATAGVSFTLGRKLRGGWRRVSGVMNDIIVCHIKQRANLVVVRVDEEVTVIKFGSFRLGEGKILFDGTALAAKVSHG
jgi:hypothetical protein